MENENNNKFNIQLTQLLRYMLMIIGILAVVINIFVLVLVHRMRNEIVRLSHMLVAIISVVDLISGFNSVVAFLFMEGIGIKESFKTSYYCPLFGFVANISILLSGILMAALAIERYILVCQEKLMSTKVTIFWILVLMTFITIPSLITSIKNELTHDPLYAYCIVDGPRWANFTNKLTTPLFILPLFVVGFCYLAILYRVCSSLSKTTSQAQITLEKQREIDSARRMVTIKSVVFIILYSTCFLPKFITLAWSYLHQERHFSPVPDIMNILAPTGINFLNCVNPILILVLHSQFKQTAIELLSRSYRIHNNTSDCPCLIIP